MSMNKQKVISTINPKILSGVAHRGLHNKDVAENSLKAFQLAISCGVAIELDVHLCKDNELIVIHDEDLKRLTHKEGIVEHLTSLELSQYKLFDGQKIPTLNEVLDLVNEQVPLLIELKVYEGNYKALSKKVCETLSKRIKDKKNYVLISFDPRSLWPTKKLGLNRLLLVSHTHKYVYTLFKHTVEGVDLEDVLLKTKRFQRYYKKHFINCWTIENEEQISKVLPYVDTITFQYIDPIDVKNILLNK